MARHLMAVCVVCLLCADHFPCEEHIESLFPSKHNAAKNLIDDRRDQYPTQYTKQVQMETLNAKIFQIIDMPMNPSTDSTATQPSRNKKQFNYNNNNSKNNNNNNNNNNINYNLYNNNNNNNNHHQRHKRHAGHGVNEAHPDHPEITEYFLKLFLRQFGNFDGTIEMHDFQKILRHLGLFKLLQRNLSNDKEMCITDTTLMDYIRNVPHYHIENSKVDCSMLIDGTKPHQQCLHDASDKDANFHHVDMNNNYTLTAEDVLNVCPVLLYQLVSHSESARAGCINDSVLSFVDNLDAAKIDAEKEDIFHVWIYAFTSVFACSILGLVGVAIIPFMDSRYYKHIIQFLVSLAVGTMTGDALLHLLPHSLAGQTEQNMIFKGLTCMGGIIFFYITEHGLTMISEWRKKIAKRETVKPSRAKVVRDPDSSMTNSVAGDKLCKSKYSSYPYCYDEIAMDTKNDIHLPAKRKLLPPTKDGLEQLDGFILATDHKRNGITITELDANETAAQSLLSTSQNNYTPICDLSRHNNIHHHNNHEQHSHTNPHAHGHAHANQQPVHHLPDSNTISTDLDGNSVGDPVNGNTDAAKDKAEGGDTVTVILREHESSHHGHSHKHGHVHSPPESLSAVAWMIIMGDGLHNFTDGMAIGAAFAENIAGGFSTSLAVFCHELPHELGDFAILLKAGMSVRTAVYYNLLTGLLSFIGMIFGIVFGQSQETAQWMFAAAAGLFIYIALVDMMPELSSSHKTIEQFILQILGMISGVLIMLLIAIYEGDLMNVFSSSSSGHNH